MNRDMVRRFTHSTPLLTSRQHQIRVTPEIHASIWKPGINHLLTIKPLEESIRKRNLGLAIMLRHKFNPSLHPLDHIKVAKDGPPHSLSCWSGRWVSAAYCRSN